MICDFFPIGGGTHVFDGGCASEGKQMAGVNQLASAGLAIMFCALMLMTSRAYIQSRLGAHLFTEAGLASAAVKASKVRVPRPNAT